MDFPASLGYCGFPSLHNYYSPLIEQSLYYEHDESVAGQS
jgi:hypothetical protein